MRIWRDGSIGLALAAAPLLGGCASHYIEVYIVGTGEKCYCNLDLSIDTNLDEVYVFPGDKVRWINTTDDEITVEDATTGKAKLFEPVTLPPRSRRTTEVPGAARHGFELELSCMQSDGGVDGPTVVVGDPP